MIYGHRYSYFNLSFHEHIFRNSGPKFKICIYKHVFVANLKFIFWVAFANGKLLFNGNCFLIIPKKCIWNIGYSEIESWILALQIGTLYTFWCKQYILRWDTGDEKNPNFLWGRGLCQYIITSQIVFLNIVDRKWKTNLSKKVAKITTVTPLRREYSDILMKWKIVGDVKIGSSI